VVAEGTPDELKREIAGDVVTVGFGDRPEVTPHAAQALDSQPYVKKLETIESGGLRLYVDAGATAIPQILRMLEASGVQISSIELHRPSLDDVFLTKTGRSLRES
jgi:ABC-2 type transport system ATP-binding protein